MPTKTSKASVARFTLANLVAASKGDLVRAKKTVEGWEAREFVSKFRDETGIAEGGYRKSNGEFVGLGIFGNGATWSAVGRAAMTLALNDEKKVAAVTAKMCLDTPSAPDPKTRSPVPAPPGTMRTSMTCLSASSRNRSGATRGPF